ncbi:MAG TPA: ATP-binding protein [Chryseosolibacter sp.]|nr:ATP-binding protein [Chryseosolibacter sp.]
MIVNVQPDERLIAQLFDTQPDSVVWFVPVFSSDEPDAKLVVDFQVKYCNAAATRILQADVSNIIGATLLSTPLMDEESRNTIFSQALLVWNTGKSVEFTYYSPGLNKHFNVQRSRVMEGVLSITRDRTDQVRAEQEIKLSAEKIKDQANLLNLILNSSINGVYTLTAVRDKEGVIVDFIITHVNDVLCKMAGRKYEDLVGKSYLQTFSHIRSSGVFARNCTILETGVPVREQHHYVGDGVDSWYDTSITKVGDDKLVIAFNDITALKKAAVELEQSNEELKRSNQRLSEFTYAASHDLNEPLRKVMMYAVLLNEQYGKSLDITAKDYLVKIDKTTRRMQLLIDDLLAYSHVTSATPELEDVSLTEIIHEVLVDIETLIAENNARVDIDTLPIIKGDRTQVRQIFQNLISNGIKFQKENVAPKINVCFLGEIVDGAAEYYQVAVRDNGIGFDETQAEHIFKLFHRLHGRREFEGTGIGLAIVHQAMKNHHGFVTAKSEPGTGSMFILHFRK